MTKSPTNASIGNAMIELATIMAALRHPETGCPWDLEQTSPSIAPYAIEEAYEVVDAIETGDDAGLCDELGDLLLQVVFHAQMASERGAFTLEDVIAGISNKMVRRHPHVFSSDKATQTAAEQTVSWEAIKAAERAQKDTQTDPHSRLDGVARALPALMRAQKLQKRAARCGFDWPDAAGAREKLIEELGEVSEAAPASANVAEEAGDLLFSCVNYVRKLGLDAEECLRAGNDKFERRFKGMEAMAQTTLEDMSLEDLEALWQRAKRSG